MQKAAYMLNIGVTLGLNRCYLAAYIGIMENQMETIILSP